MSFHLIKRKIYNMILFVIDFLIYMSCLINSPKLCAYFIKISLLKPNSLKKKKNSKNKIIILLYRSIGIRDVEIISKLSDTIPEILILRRRVVKIILNHFIYRKKYFNFFRKKPSKQEFLNQNLKDKKNHESFWAEILLNLNIYIKNKEINFITFAYYYYVEQGLYVACKRMNIPVKLWNKECFMSDADVNFRVKLNEYKDVFKYFKKISTYNQFMKKMLIKMDKFNKEKTTVNGCPRRFDFIKKGRSYKKVNNILFLSFNPKQGFPNDRKYKNFNWNLTYSKVLKILNELASNKYLNIIIKIKNINAYKPNIHIDERIKIIEGGTAEKYINKSDIIIGLNSGSTIESLVNGKFVMVPFFEKNKKLKKYLYKFDKSIIYTSEKKMKIDILNLINKKFLFPLKNTRYTKTIDYYYGSSKKIKENYINFINS